MKSIKGKNKGNNNLVAVLIIWISIRSLHWRSELFFRRNKSSVATLNSKSKQKKQHNNVYMR